MKLKILLLTILFFSYAYAQESKKVLFIGNSYTYVNDLPQLVNQIAQSTGDELVTASNTIGGATLELHSQNVSTLNLIKSGNWDNVVLQEQSQRPSLSDNYVAANVYPYAQQLSDSIFKYNLCARTTFYMTWGRKNGDASNCVFFPPVCTYQGMDDLLRERYQIMANDNSDLVAPVGVVWRFLRNNYPELNLYQSDESHPSLLGSYAAAVVFYTVIFKKDPNLITFNSSLSATNATIIKNAVRQIVYFNLLEWNIEELVITSNFTYTNNGAEYNFINQSLNASYYIWDFGDGTISTLENPQHTYIDNGDYTVKLTAIGCNTAVSNQTLQIVLNENEYNTNKLVFNTLINQYLDLNLNNVEMNGELKIYNIYGKLVFKKPINLYNYKNKIDLSNLIKGVYFLTLIENGNKILANTKIIKQ